MPIGLNPIEIILLLIISAFWVWMLVDCVINTSVKGTRKVLWFLLILLTHLVGALIYFFIGRSPRKAA